MKTKKIDFTEKERELVEESFQQFMNTVSLMARLHGIRGQMQLSEDRSGVVIQVSEEKTDA